MCNFYVKFVSYSPAFRYRGPLFGFTYLYFKRLCFLQMYDRDDDFDFDIVNFPFLDGDVSLHSVFLTEYISLSF